jgi:hypothetical protein
MLVERAHISARQEKEKTSSYEHSRTAFNRIAGDNEADDISRPIHSEDAHCQPPGPLVAANKPHSGDRCSGAYRE